MSDRANMRALVSDGPKFKSEAHTSVKHWASYLLSLCLSFLTSMAILILPTSLLVVKVK